MSSEFPKRWKGAVASTVVVIAVSVLFGMLVRWGAPGLNRYASDWLMRTRGALAAPDDIAIVAIDERSVARLGQFPWRRSVLARAVDMVAGGKPKAIGLDIMFADATSLEDDAVLAQSISRAGKVGIAAQLVQSQTEQRAEWLLPYAAIGQASAGVGHVNVSVESDGIGRQLMLRLADYRGSILLGLPVELVRIGENVEPKTITDTGRALLVGKRSIVVESAPPVAPVGHTGVSQVELVRPARMIIDYIGPTNSFAANTFSLVDVLDGRVSANTFRGRYVLIGVTTASTGDRIASPFVHQETGEGNQNGTLMPGVEVLANALNTILRQRYYTPLSEGGTVAIACLAAAFTLAALAFVERKNGVLSQILALTGLIALTLLCSVFAYKELLIVTQIAPLLATVSSAGMLGLVRRSLITSKELDNNLAAVVRAGSLLIRDSTPDQTSAAIGRVLDVPAVAMFTRKSKSTYTVTAEYGAPVKESLRRTTGVALPLSQVATEVFEFAAGTTMGAQLTVVLLVTDLGAVIVACMPGSKPPSHRLQVCIEMADDCFRAERSTNPGSPWTLPFPVPLEEKARVLGSLNDRLLQRTAFLHRAIQATEDGLVITSVDGTVRLSNPNAALILQSPEGALAGRNLFDCLENCDRNFSGNARGSLLTRLLIDRTAVEHELTPNSKIPHQYTLRIAPVFDPRGPVTGFVASLSDITRQKQLQQTQNDVMALVSHEMRTPLTAIQGMSELLTTFDVGPDRRGELSSAINDEVKRLTRMVTQYLDLTRLQSGAAQLRYVPIRLEALVDRALLLLQPMAALRGIGFEREYAEGVPPIVADAELLMRVAENLISNAIKYSPRETIVRIVIRASCGQTVSLDVADAGYGMSEVDLTRIFDKFYRVPRPQDADVPGTGLGLSLVREIAELHDGSVSVTSEVNVGSTFTFTIPVVPEEEGDRTGRGENTLPA